MATRFELAVVGAGFLGSDVARAWQEGPVLATTRSGAWPHGEPPPHVAVQALDVTADPLLDAHALTHAAALLVCVAPGREEGRRALYVDGVKRLLDALAGHRFRRVVYIGSTSALPDRDAWLDERTTAWPDDDRGRVQREAETIVTAHCDAHAIPCFVLRLGGLYGPGRPLAAIYGRRGDAPLSGDGNVPTNLVHRDDAVAAVLSALARPPHEGGLVHVVDDDHTPRRRMYAAHARARGQPDVQWEHEPRPGAPPRGKRVSNLRMKSSLGVRLLHPTHGDPNHLRTEGK